jgi:hypothetical protein
MVQKSGRNITEKWEQLIGPMNEFSKANRSVNAVLVISFALMMLNIPINIALNLVVSNLISIGFSIIIFILYYLSRYRKAYRTSMTLYGVISYIGLIANYWYNSYYLSFFPDLPVDHCYDPAEAAPYLGKSSPYNGHRLVNIGIHESIFKT